MDNFFYFWSTQLLIRFFCYYL